MENQSANQRVEEVRASGIENSVNEVNQLQTMLTDIWKHRFQLMKQLEDNYLWERQVVTSIKHLHEALAALDHPTVADMSKNEDNSAWKTVDFSSTAHDYTLYEC